jgi:DinB superfamily
MWMEMVMRATAERDALPEDLKVSGDHVLALAQVGRLDPGALATATAARAIGAATLLATPRNPVLHVETAHATARVYLRRLTAHRPSVEVPSVMTSRIFAALTGAPPPQAEVRYTYTPRKVLRRVLDHALDHLNQIDQWVAWRRAGIVPTPTDGWAPSTVTLPEDRLPLDTADLDAWMWRIDQAVHLLGQRAAALSEDELDWQPPDGGWPLRRVLHHVARSELLYATALDDALPEEPIARYAEARRRFDERFAAAWERREDGSILYVNTYGAVSTPDAVGRQVRDSERGLTGALV